MNIKEAINAYQRLSAELEATRGQEYARIGADALALVKRRIINKGELSDGQKLGNYSTKPVPYWFYKGKETVRNNAKAVADLLKQFGYFASYKDWREVNNLPTSFINLSFTAKMWKSVFAKLEKQTPQAVTIGISASTERDKKLLGYHQERWGNLLALNVAELQYIKNAIDARLKRLFTKYFGSL